MRQVVGIWALLLVAPALAQDEPEEPPKPPEPKVEELIGGGVTTRRRDGPVVRVRLHSGGQLQFRGDDGWTDTTLAKLGAFLGRARDEHDAKAKKAGKSGYRTLPGGAKVSTLFVAIDADPGTPWQHVQWIMTIAEEQKFWKLALKCEKRRITLCLPAGAKPVKGAPAEIVVPIHVVARAEKATPWGGGMVLRPTTFKYREGNREVGNLAGVARLIQDAKKAAENADEPTIVAGVIEAGNKVPFTEMFDVLETFAKEGVAHVRCHGQVPVDEMRKAERLPYPAKNYETPD
jgi:hypothetical protein